DVPLLSPPAWEGALLAHGFDAVRAFPKAGSAAETLRQHVIVARRVATDAVEEPGTSWESEWAEETAATGPVGGDEDGRTRLTRLAALPERERHEQLVAFIGDCIVQVLRLGQSRAPARDERLMDFGIDSLMAVELRNVLTA